MGHEPPVRVDDEALLEEMLRAVLQSGVLTSVAACRHCWHLPRVWQGPLPTPRHCCWCGIQEGPQHGPYAER